MSHGWPVWPLRLLLQKHKDLKDTGVVIHLSHSFAFGLFGRVLHPRSPYTLLTPACFRLPKSSYQKPKMLPKSLRHLQRWSLACILPELLLVGDSVLSTNHHLWCHLRHLIYIPSLLQYCTIQVTNARIQATEIPIIRRRFAMYNSVRVCCQPIEPWMFATPASIASSSSMISSPTSFTSRVILNGTALASCRMMSVSSPRMLCWW